MLPISTPETHKTLLLPNYRKNQRFNFLIASNINEKKKNPRVELPESSVGSLCYGKEEEKNWWVAWGDVGLRDICKDARVG